MCVVAHTAAPVPGLETKGEGWEDAGRGGAVVQTVRRARGRVTNEQRWRDTGLSALVLILLAYGWLFSGVSVPNERTRVYLTVALVDHGTAAIDAPMRRFGRVYDLAQAGEQHFTDKAPGASLLAVPLYALVRSWSAPEDWSIVDLSNLVRTWLMVPFGLAGFVLVRSLLRELELSEPAIDVSSLAFSLGTPMFHYSTAFYGHALVAVMLLAALRCLAAAGVLARARPARSAPNDGHARPGRFAAALAGAGACAGLAGLIEYQAIALGLVLALPILFAPGRARVVGLLAYAAGALPFAALLLHYNTSAFGGPFELSYQHLVGSSLQELHGFGLAGATFPTRESLQGLLYSQHRGLLFSAPLLTLGLFALPFLLPRFGVALWLVLTVASVYFLYIVASSSVWFGGWSFGPRLLIPIFGLLTLAAAAVFDRAARRPALQWCMRGAAVFSILYQQAVQASFPELPPSYERPWADAIGPMLHAGIVSPNLACKLWGLERSNLIPLAILVTVVLLIVALRGAMQRRLLQAGAVLGLAALLCAALMSASPSIAPKEQAGWLRLATGWRASETRCLPP